MLFLTLDLILFFIFILLMTEEIGLRKEVFIVWFFLLLFCNSLLNWDIILVTFLSTEIFSNRVDWRL